MNKLALSGLALGTALAAAGSAQAEPLTLATGQMEQVTAAGVFYVDVDVDKNVHKRVQLDIFKSIFAGVFIKGHLGDAEASSQAWGSNTLAETLTLANASHSGFSDAFSQSVAAVQDKAVKRPRK